MARKRSANRGWRSKMKQYIESNPEVQAQVAEIERQQKVAQLESLKESQVQVAEQIALLESQVAEPVTETPSE